MTFIKLSTREAVERGAQKEKYFFRALSRRTDETPAWLERIEQASVHHDHDGVDAFAYTDQGKIPIQIKSSEGGFREHVKRYGYKHVILVVNDSMPASLLRSRTYYELGKRRTILIRIRGPESNSKPTDWTIKHAVAMLNAAVSAPASLPVWLKSLRVLPPPHKDEKPSVEAIFLSRQNARRIVLVKAFHDVRSKESYRNHHFPPAHLTCLIVTQHQTEDEVRRLLILAVEQMR